MQQPAVAWPEVRPQVPQCDTCSSSYNASALLLAASRAGELEHVRKLVTDAERTGTSCGLADPQAVNAALWAACDAGHTAIVRYLVAHGAIGADVEATDSRGDTPLIVATIRGRADVVQALLDCGADPLGTVVTTAPDVAKRLGIDHILRLLEAGGDVDAESDGETASDTTDEWGFVVQ